MSRIYFHTNLDEARLDVARLNSGPLFNGNEYQPQVGHIVRFPLMASGSRAAGRFDLEVCEVVYDVQTNSVSVELSIPRCNVQSIMQWSQWIRERRGQ